MSETKHHTPEAVYINCLCVKILLPEIGFIAVRESKFKPLDFSAFQIAAYEVARLHSNSICSILFDLATAKPIVFIIVARETQLRLIATHVKILFGFCRN